MLAVFVPVAQTRSSGGNVKKVALGVVAANIRGEYGKVWPLLHPRYQLVTTRAFWESCQRKKAASQTGIEWLSIKATDAYPDRVTLPLLGNVRVTAVTIEAKIEYLGSRHTVTDTNYWIKIGSRWRGTWKPEVYRAYKAHRCPA
jgi:hypothetical protein